MRSFYVPLPVVAAAMKPFYRLALNHRLPYSVQRLVLEVGAPLQTLPHGTVAHKLTLAGRAAERVTVGATERDTATLYLHGGAFTIGSINTHRSLAAHLARESASAVYVLDYRLAPENPYPAALDDAVAAFHELVRTHGFTPDRIAIAGDSAGGGLTVSTARRLVDDGVHPAVLGLISPWVDPGARDAVKERDMVVNTAWSNASAEAYLGAGDPLDQGFAPLHGDLTGLPPIVMHVGTEEVLYQQITSFADRVRRAGVELEFMEYKQLWHVAHLQASILREAAQAVHHMGRYLRKKLERSQIALTEPAASDIA